MPNIIFLSRQRRRIKACLLYTSTRFADSVREKSEASGSIVGNSKIGSVSAKDLSLIHIYVVMDVGSVYGSYYETAKSYMGLGKEEKQAGFAEKVTDKKI